MLLHVGVRQGVDLIVIMIGVIACWCQTRGGPDCNHDRCYCMLVSDKGWTWLQSWSMCSYSQGPPARWMSNWYRSLQDHNYLIRHSWVISCYSAAIPSTILQWPVQFSLNVQAEDYDTCIAGPQREERLRRMEEQMKLIRGFRGEGQTLRGEEPVSRVQGGGTNTEGRGTSA